MYDFEVLLLSYLHEQKTD